MLRLDENIVKEPLGIKAYRVFSNRIKATIFFEKVESEAERITKTTQIELLKASIKRRENLLANENYVKKAIEAGMTTIGFSDHTPNMFGKDNPESAMTMEQFMDEYVPELEALREKYKDKIDLKIVYQTYLHILIQIYQENMA